MAATVEAFNTARAGSPLSPASSITITKPTGLADNDYLVALCVSDSSTTSSWSAPAGFTEHADDDDGDIVTAVFYKLITDASLEAADYTFSVSAADDLCGALAIVRGADTTTFIDVSATDTGTTVSLQADCPSVTTTNNDTLVLWLIGFDDDDNATPTSANPETSLFVAGSGDDGPHFFASGSGQGHCMQGFDYSTEATAGATGTRTFEIDPDSGSTQETYRSHSIAINTAPAAGNPARLIDGNLVAGGFLEGGSVVR